MLPPKFPGFFPKWKAPLVFLSLIIGHIRRFLYLEQVAVGVHLACNAGVFWVAEIERVAAIFNFMTVEDWGE